MSPSGDEVVYLLEKDVVEIDGVRFVGTILWSDLSNPVNASMAACGMNDYRLIKNGGGILSPSDTTVEWGICRNFIDRSLMQKFDGKTVVVTHHSPTPVTTAPQFVSSGMRFAFHSDMNELILKHKPDLWVYGHDHCDFVGNVGDTMVVSNQVGYSRGNDVNVVVFEI